MSTQLEQAKALILAGETYPDTAKAVGYGNHAALHAALKDDPDIVAAKASGQLRSRATKGPEHYARKPYVQAVLNGMTQVEAAAKFSVSQPLVGRHLKLAGGAAKVGRPPTTSPSPSGPPPAPTNDVALIADLIKAHAQRLNIPAKTLLESVSEAL